MSPGHALRQPPPLGYPAASSDESYWVQGVVKQTRDRPKVLVWWGVLWRVHPPRGIRRQVWWRVWRIMADKRARGGGGAGVVASASMVGVEGAFAWELSS
eukprot:scaffold2019_cov129-Isochrysis_galbana.AAC.2